MEIRERFLGAWTLKSLEARSSGGPASRPFGDDAVGSIMYDDSGRFSVNVMRPGRPLFDSGDMVRGTPEEVAAAYSGYIAYAGRFEVDEDAGTMTHIVEASLFPNWVGDRQIRYYEFADAYEELILSTDPTLFEGVEIRGVISWQRA